MTKICVTPPSDLGHMFLAHLVGLKEHLRRTSKTPILAIELISAKIMNARARYRHESGCPSNTLSTP